MTFYADRVEDGIPVRWCPGCEKWKPRQGSFRGRRTCRTCEASKERSDPGRLKAYRGAKRDYTHIGRERSPFSGDSVDVKGLDRFLRAPRAGAAAKSSGS